MTTARSQDTEITLGTGKMLALFFGLVMLCAVFFGMGFSFGRNSLKTGIAELDTATTTTNSRVRPATVKPVNAANAPSDQSLFKSVETKNADSAAANTNTADTASKGAEASPNPPDPAAVPALNGYYVQVAAVSKQEDAEALVGALKSKQYPAFAASAAADKLFHIQVGPYADIKDAEGMRAKLVTDGYNPILKK